VGCKLIAADGFCAYCQRLVDREPVTIARRRWRRNPGLAMLDQALDRLKTGASS
jgi:hypothetical protein